MATKKATKKAPTKRATRKKAPSKAPATQEDKGGVTLEWREPPAITYGSRAQQYPYQEACDTLVQKPGEWLSLRTGPRKRMDQFIKRFRSFVQPSEGYDLEVVARTIDPEDQQSTPYNHRLTEVFARVVEVEEG